MEIKRFKKSNRELLDQLSNKHLSPLDLIPQEEMREKLVELALNGVPEYADWESAILLRDFIKNFENQQVKEVNVVVFGGGTGLSNIIGGDSRQESWVKKPFDGLKHIFPNTRAIVCVTDDGGSTGELLKDIPMIALGDIRHVLLSSIQKKRLIEKYNLSERESHHQAKALYRLFNYRFKNIPESAEQLIRQCDVDIVTMPEQIQKLISESLHYCFKNEICRKTLKRPQCLGNVIIMAYLLMRVELRCSEKKAGDNVEEINELIFEGLSKCAETIGAAEDGVIPCTLTPAQLRFLYTNGVEVSGEKKSSEAQRGYPVERVFVDFCGEPYVSRSMLEEIKSADILIMAPGSLYSSIIPVLQVPEIAQAVRNNKKALKLLIANLWVQAGETDKSISDPERKFHVSDMIRAYHRNLPGGTDGLFDQVLCLSLKDIPATVLQNYAVEGKIPIYLDKDLLKSQGFTPVECGFFSRAALSERQVIQHDPHIVAQTVKTLFLAEKLIGNELKKKKVKKTDDLTENQSRIIKIPSERYRNIKDKMYSVPVSIRCREGFLHDEDKIREMLTDIIWEHKDIDISHLENIDGITCIANSDWRRDQRWDNVFSFYDPDDGQVKIRQDRFENRRNLEVAFLITIGQALLGDYAKEKRVETVAIGEHVTGNIFHLYLKNKSERKSFFGDDEIQEYLELARMVKQSNVHFTRLINGEEGFTPPGLLLGVVYAWYLDNSFASNIEYKMSVLKIGKSDLIPEQLKMMKRRTRLIAFFRQTVFGKNFKMI